MTTYIGNTPEGAKSLQAQMPIGTVVAWASAQIPAGWLECNGQVTDGYPLLEALIGSNVPDLRGQFVRGLDNGAGVDTGRALGSSQTDELKAHSHQLGAIRQFDNNGSYPWVVDGGANQAEQFQFTTDTGGTETRPKNVALIYIIKAYDVVSVDEVGSYTIGKNYIINPTFSINQRGFAGGVVADSAYFYDRWLSGGAGRSVTLPDANGFITISGSVGTSGIQYRVEQFGYIGAATLSWEGTAQAQYLEANGGVVFSTPASSPITFNMVAGGGTLAGVAEFFVFGDGTLKNVKLEIGSVATKFEYPDPATELVKCQRYYETNSGNYSFDYALAGYQPFFTTPFLVQKRISPSVSWQNVGSNNLNLTSQSISASKNGITPYVNTIVVTGNANLVWSYTADAEL